MFLLYHTLHILSMVGDTGVEPVTFSTSKKRSSQLS